MTEEEKVRDLIRQMHEKAQSAPWALSAADIRSQRRRRAVQMPNPKVLGLAAAAIVIVLLVVLVGTGNGSGGHKANSLAVPPVSTTTTTAPPSTTTTTNGVPRVTVPELVDESQAQAKANLAHLGLTVGQIHFAPSASGAGIVISQAPSAGSFVAPGSVVMITVSSGPTTTVASGATAGSDVYPSPAPATDLTEDSTSVLGCLDPRATAVEPRGGWLPTTGGVLDYNPDSTDSAPAELSSAQAKHMAMRFASLSGHHFAIVEAKATGTPHCAVVQWAVLHDKTEDSAYVALLQLRRPVDPDSFPLLGASTNRLKLRNGTVVLSSQSTGGGVVTIVAARPDGLTVLLQIRRAGDEDGVGYPTTITLQGSGASHSTGPALISEAHAVRIGSIVLSKADSKLLRTAASRSRRPTGDSR